MPNNDKINFLDLPDLLSTLSGASSKDFNSLIQQAEHFNEMLKVTLNLASQRRKISQQMSASHFINHIATELFNSIEEALPTEDEAAKASYDAELKEFKEKLIHLKTKELKELEEHLEKCKYIMTPQQRFELLKSHGIEMLGENYASFHSPGQLGKVISKFCEVFKSEGAETVSFEISTPPLSDTESEQIRNNVSSMSEKREKYLIAVFEKAAEQGYPPSKVSITLDGKKYDYTDEAFKKMLPEWKKTAETYNQRLVKNVEEDYEHRSSLSP